jgi:stalled ribosome rescue protein Dom34
MISKKHSNRPRISLAEKRKRAAAPHGTPKRVIISGEAAGHDTLRPARAARRSARVETVAGLWIDRRKAVIAVISAAGDALTEIHAGVEWEPSRFSGSQSTTTYESQLVKSDDRHLRRFTGRMGHYYDRVAAALGKTHAILILGPGEAKGEFRKHLVQSGPGDRSIGMAAAGGMSTRQLVARIRTHFRPQGSSS